MSSPTQDSVGSIAIVGMSGRFPGADCVDEFWKNLREGVESVTFFSDDELLDAGVDPKLIQDSHYVKARGTLNNIELFDARLFEIATSDARAMDPQHRLFLECAWTALESSGYDPAKFAGKIGVFAGSSPSSYALQGILTGRSLMDHNNASSVPIIYSDYLPTLLSYKLGFTGPSINVQTACSTSLVAVCLGCESLLSYRSDMILAGGVSIYVPQQSGQYYSSGGIISPDGHCRAFDAKAQGTVMGNGLGIVVLKRLEDAISDRDNIHAVIKSSALNNDGSSKVSFSAPRTEGQAEVIAMAHAIADTPPETITYIETHGTGTELGDPIEIAALSQAFRLGTDRKQFCAIGTAKSNVGHLDAAAGVTGLIKTVLSLKHKQLPPILHFNQPNKAIDIDGSPFYVNEKLSPWNAPEPRRAGISSFGFGGTNAHVILEEAPQIQPTKSARTAELLVLSANTRGVLETASHNLADHLKIHPEVNVADLAFTLQVGRKELKYRRAFVCRDASDALRTLELEESGETLPATPSEHRPVAFLFHGECDLPSNITLELYQLEPVFREAMDECAEHILCFLDVDIRKLLYTSTEFTDRANESLSQPVFRNPTLVSIEYALAKMWMQWGVIPEAMTGLGVGEYVAAVLSGVLTLESALMLSVARGRISESMHFGETTQETNLSEFRMHIESFDLKGPCIPYVSSLTGQWITASQSSDPAYWVRHLLEEPCLDDAIGLLLNEPSQVMLQIGSNSSLQQIAAEHPARGCEHTFAELMGHSKPNEDEFYSMLTTLGHLWISGVNIDWQGLHSHEKRRRISLPTYPFDRQRYWFDEIPKKHGSEASNVETEQLSDIADWFQVPIWKQSISTVFTHSAASTTQKWLIFADCVGLGSRLSAVLKKANHSVVTVRQSDDFSCLGIDSYAISPNAPEHYARLLSELTFQDKLPQKIVYLWGFTDGDETTPIYSNDQEKHICFNCLIHLTRAVGNIHPPVPLDLAVVTRGLCNVTGAEHLCPESATILGLCKSLPLEYPEIKCRVIDIVLPDDGITQQDQLPELLVAECSERSSDSLVAYRGGFRWVPELDPLPLSGNTCRSRIRQHGVYLITGGLGSMGFAFAKFLAQNYQAKLVLIGRSGLPTQHFTTNLPNSPEVGHHKLGDHDGTAIATPDDYDAISILEEDKRKKLGITPIQNFDGLEAKLNQFCAGLIYDYLVTGTPLHNDACDVEGLRRHLGILPKFDKFFTYMLQVMCDSELIILEHGRISLTDTKLKTTSRLKHELTLSYPNFHGLIDLLDHCAKHYRKALSGGIEAIGVLFPEGGKELRLRATQDTVKYHAAEIYCAVMDDVIHRMAQQTGGKRLRVLEVGGGSGNLTAHMLSTFTSGNLDYCFTDIGPSFLKTAKQEALKRGLSAMRFEVLDISKNPVQQGFAEGSFDVILGLDAVHATRNLVSTVDNLRQLLAPGGSMFLIETVKSERWINMVWGLAEGWWYFEDDVRSVSPLLDLDRWEEVFRARGFESVKTYPRQNPERGQVDSGLIVFKTESDGQSNLRDEGDTSGNRRTTAQKVRQIHEIEQFGSEVLVLKADVSDPESMRTVVDETINRFGSINGVIHAAGVLGPALIHEITSDQVSEVFAPKVDGTRVLEQVLKDQSPDFMVLCSSGSSISPMVGQAAYSAANCFLDSFSQQRSRDPSDCYTVSINWAWWQELGMAADGKMAPEAMRKFEETNGKYSDTGGEILRRILSECTAPQIMVSNRRIVDSRIPLAAKPTMTKSSSQSTLQIENTSSRPDLSSPYIAPNNSMERQIARIWAEVLGIQAIGIRDNFYDLGGDSLLALKITARLHDSFQRDLSLRTVLESGTIEKLAALVAEAPPAPREPPLEMLSSSDPP